MLPVPRCQPLTLTNAHCAGGRGGGAAQSCRGQGAGGAPERAADPAAADQGAAGEVRGGGWRGGATLPGSAGEMSEGWADLHLLHTFNHPMQAAQGGGGYQEGPAAHPGRIHTFTTLFTPPGAGSARRRRIPRRTSSASWAKGGRRCRSRWASGGDRGCHCLGICGSPDPSTLRHTWAREGCSICYFSS